MNDIETTAVAIDALTAAISAVNASFRRFAGDACCPAYRDALVRQGANRREAERLMPGADVAAKRRAFPGI